MWIYRGTTYYLAADCMCPSQNIHHTVYQLVFNQINQQHSKRITIMHDNIYNACELYTLWSTPTHLQDTM